jgi:mannose-6-phosphate isomerase-like protein (cupin superfamily)
MKVNNRFISNPVTHQDIRFLQTSADTSGKLLEMESTYHSCSTEPPSHHHPFQTEEFTIVQGEMNIRLNGMVRELKEGDVLRIPKNTPHSMWNSKALPAVVNWRVMPALETEMLLKNMTGLAVDGKTNARGMPGTLQLALTANRFSDELRLSGIPFIVQKLIFILLTPLALLRGLRAVYAKYS